MQGGRRNLHDAGDGNLRDPLLQKRPDVLFLAVELRLAPRPLGPTEALAARPGGRQTLLGPLHDQVAFDLGKEPEQDDHRLGLEILACPRTEWPP